MPDDTTEKRYKDMDMKRTILLASALLMATATLSSPAFAGGPKHCPPGLAKKGCTPPGQAKKRYQVGQPVLQEVPVAPVEWRNRYAPPPAGTLYGQVDGDILLIAEGTRRVIELIGIADALTN